MAKRLCIAVVISGLLIVAAMAFWPTNPRYRFLEGTEYLGSTLQGPDWPGGVTRWYLTATPYKEIGERVGSEMASLGATNFSNSGAYTWQFVYGEEAVWVYPPNSDTVRMVAPSVLVSARGRTVVTVTRRENRFRLWLRPVLHLRR